MSLKIAMSSQNQMMNRKNHNIERKTSPDPKSASTIVRVSLLVHVDPDDQHDF
jgi:hypothetical protein